MAAGWSGGTGGGRARRRRGAAGLVDPLDACGRAWACTCGRGRNQRLGQQAPSDRFPKGPRTADLGGLLKIFTADPGFLAAGSLGAPHGASPTPVREAGDALVARACSPTLPALTYFTPTSEPGPSFAPISSYSNRVARLPVRHILWGERLRLVRSHSVHHTPSPAVAAGATHAAVRPPSKQQNWPEKL